MPQALEIRQSSSGFSAGLTYGLGIKQISGASHPGPPLQGPYLLLGAFFHLTNSGSVGQSGSSSNLLRSAAKAVARPVLEDTAQALSGPVEAR